MASARRNKDKSKIKNISEGHSGSEEETIVLNNHLNKVNDFINEVLNSISSEKLQVTPKNFTFFFYKILEKQNSDIQNKIISTIELEDEDVNNDNVLEMEKKLKEGFIKIKETLNTNTLLYKNMSVMIKILEKRRNDIKQKKLSITEIANLLETDIGKLNNVLKKNNNVVKKIYTETKEIITRIQSKSIFDEEFNIYNKRYFVELIKTEQKIIKNFNHHSSLISIQLAQKKREELKDPSMIKMLIKTLSKLLLKTSRRSDILAHYGNGIFMILLKHTNYENALKTSDRLKTLVKNTNLFFGEEEVNLEVDIGVIEISVNEEYSETIVKSLDNMNSENMIEEL